MIFETQQKNPLIGDWNVSLPQCPAAGRGPDDATPGRWRHSGLTYAGFVAAIAIITAFAVLATPAAVYAQSTDGPTATGVIPAQRLRVDGWAVTLNVRKYFEASGALAIEVGSLDETVATASAMGETVTIVPVKKGATVIEVTAQNSGGSAVQPISVTVGPAVPPLAYTIDTVAATKYRITNPQDVVVDGDGKLYVVESLVQQGRRIHKVDAAAGTISIIAGTGEDGYNGDGGPATGARLSFPIGVTVGADCRLYVADTGNHRIRLLKPHLALESGGCASASAAAR